MENRSLERKIFNKIAGIFVLLILLFVKVILASNDPRTDVKYDKSLDNIYWFIQASDVHIGDEEIIAGGVELKYFLEKSVSTIKPKLVVVTGDLTDASDPGVWWGYLQKLNKLLWKLKGQQKDEWLKYGEIVNEQDPEFYFDLAGNHDRYGDPNWEGLIKDSVPYGYTINSVLGKKTFPGSSDVPVGQFSKTVSVNGNDHLFIGTNTCDEEGKEFDPWKFKFYSDKPTLSVVERIYIGDELEAFKRNPNRKLSFIFGHAGIYTLAPSFSVFDPFGLEHKLNELGGVDKGRGGSDFVELLNDYKVSSYLFGHTHKNRDLYDLNTKHEISSRVINTSSLTENDTYRIVAVDNNGVSTITAKITEWPVVLVTSPLDSKTTGLNNIYSEQSINNPYAYRLKPISSNFIRAIAFFDPSQTDKKVEFKFKKKTWLEGWSDPMAMREVSPNIWQGGWNCFEPEVLEEGEYEIEVRAIGLGGKEAKHTITVEISNNECAFLYPNSGEYLKGQFNLKGMIDNSLNPTFARFYYSQDDKKTWKQTGDNLLFFPNPAEKSFDSETLISSGGKVWFKIEYQIPTGLFTSRTIEDESDEAVTIDNILPTIPQNLSAKPVKDGAIELSWKPSTDDNLSGYKIYRSINEIDYPLQYDGIIGNTFTDSFAENGKTYAYKVKAYDLAGNESDFSNIASTVADNISPLPLANFTTQSGDTHITLTWQNPSDPDFAEIEIYRFTQNPLVTYYSNILNAAEFTKLDLENDPTNYTTKYTDTNEGLIENEMYYYVIYQYDANNQIIEVWNISNTVKDGKIDLLWTNPAQINRMELYRLGQEPLTVCGDLIRAQGPIYKGTSITYTDLNLINEKKYYYVGYAKDFAGNYSDGVMENSIPGMFLELFVLYDVSLDAVPGSAFLSEITGNYNQILQEIAAGCTKNENLNVKIIPFAGTVSSRFYLMNHENNELGALQNEVNNTSAESFNYLDRYRTRLLSGLSEVMTQLGQDQSKPRKVLILSDWEDWAFPPHYWQSKRKPEWVDLIGYNSAQPKINGKIIDQTKENGFTAMHFWNPGSFDVGEYMKWISLFYWDYRESDLKKHLSVFGRDDTIKWKTFMRKKLPELNIDITNSITTVMSYNQIAYLPVDIYMDEVLAFTSNCTGVMKIYFTPPEGERTQIDFSQDPNKKLISSAHSNLAIIPDPEEGKWEMEFTSQDTTTSQVKLMSMVRGPLKLFPAISEDAKQGENYKIAAQLELKIQESEISSKEVQATISSANDEYNSTGDLVTDALVTLYDDGLHDDLEANDGLYANSILLEKIEGPKKINIIGSVTTKDKKTISTEYAKIVDIKGNSPLVEIKKVASCQVTTSPVIIVDESPLIVCGTVFILFT